MLVSTKVIGQKGKKAEDNNYNSGHAKFFNIIKPC